ncbi:MAG: DUF1592 domain-containing protein [Armatimonadota bacterium]
MRSWLIAAPPLSLLLLIGLSAVPTSGRQTTRPKKTPTLEETAWPFFSENCVSCHNAETKSGALDMETLRKPGSVTRSRETWESVIRKTQTGEMPPAGMPRPAPAKIKALSATVEREFDRVDKIAASNPGNVTAHRLNRAEYNNTVRDLVGVTFRPADDFPQDDSGYGFDNIGDVLSLSSSQMEKYVSASEKIARTALFGAEPLKPTLLRHDEPGRRIEAVEAFPARYDTTGLNLPNSRHAMHRFPVEGEYLFRFGLNGVRPLGSEAIRLALWIDGKRVQTMTFDPTGSAAFSLDRQDFSGRTQECRFRVPAGDHWVAATIERLYEGLPASYQGPNPATRKVELPQFKPRPGLTPEEIEERRKRFEERLKEKAPINDVRVSFLEVGGPYAQAKGPSEVSLRKIYVCGHTDGGHTAACTPKIVGNLARRAFRRPVTQKEIGRFSSLVSLAQKQGDSYEEGICLAMQGILVSPHFLFRIEKDAQTPAKGQPHLLTQHELASRLSYFLWSTMPDDELRACADRQTLRNPGVLAAQVRRMLKDPRSYALAENFGGQWLQFRALESSRPDRERFPDFDSYLRLSMQEETVRFVDSIVRDDRSILTLLQGKYTFLNERLANFYGISGVSGPAFRKVSLAGTKRGGVLTQASVLTVTSYPNRTSPVLRGKWILENILFAPPPDPPPGVPNLDVGGVGSAKSLRAQLEEHRKNPTCASCHSRMDPLGFGLENFDAIGAWRKKDGDIAIDSSGTLPDGRKFVGPSGLGSVLKTDSDAFVHGVSGKLLTYALGRGLDHSDRATVKQIARTTAGDDYRFSRLVLEIVSSRPFQMRKGNSL